MQILTDLTSQLLKTVNVNVLERTYDRKVSYGMQSVVEDSGEGWCFLQLGDAMSFDDAQDDGCSKSCPGATGKRVGCGGFFT